MDKFRYEGLCCPVCNAKLFDDDDIAVCPICGAPHHRDCFNYEGHCHFESTHGTPEQWTMPKEDTQKSNFENENQQGFENFNPQQFYNSNQQTEQQIPNIISFCAATLEEDIDEDIKGKDVIHFVYSNSPRYLEIFKKQVRQKTTISWNFAAFLFPELWLASRKMWFLAIPLTLISVALSTILNIIIDPVTQAMQTSGLPAAVNLLNETEQLIVLSLGLCSIAISIFFGLFGDYIYRLFAFKKIRELKKNNSCTKENCVTAGGCSLLNIVVVFFAQQAVANLVSVVLRYFNII